MTNLTFLTKTEVNVEVSKDDSGRGGLEVVSCNMRSYKMSALWVAFIYGFYLWSPNMLNLEG